MLPSKSKNSKINFKSYLGNSMKFVSGTGPSTSMAKHKNNNTLICDVNIPTSTISHKINIKNNLITKKKTVASKKKK